MILRRRIMVTGGSDKASQYLTFYSITNCTHKFTNAVKYSLDGGTTWKDLSSASPLTVKAGNSVMWKATLTPGRSQGVGGFYVTDTSMRFNVEGNPMSLLYGDNFIGQTDLTGKRHAFRRMFYNNTGVVDAQNMALPAMTLTDECYYGMFFGCTSLTTAPAILPATTLAYNCYGNMFYNCTSLTTTPTTLPATALEVNCYQAMFYNCSSLTTAPAILPATILTKSCYDNMFSGCTSLTTAPELPATTLAQTCYQQMFYGCSSLNYIKCMATNISASYCLWEWIDGVAASGTFVKASSMSSWPTDVDGIPSGWTVQDA